MSLILTIVLIFATGILFASLFFVATTTSLDPSEAPSTAELSLERIEALLERGEVEGSYASFLFYPDDLVERHDPPSFQMTYAGGRVCVDWPLTSARSRRDRKRFDVFARLNASAISHQIGPHGSYARVITEAPAAFCRTMLRDLYGIGEGDRLVMIFHGIDWSTIPARVARTKLTAASAPRVHGPVPTLR